MSAQPHCLPTPPPQHILVCSSPCMCSALCSRFQPYIDSWPSPTEVVNLCNMDLKYTKMWKSPYWVGTADILDTGVGYRYNGTLLRSRTGACFFALARCSTTPAQPLDPRASRS